MIEIPEGLQWVSFLAGNKWPRGDETAMFAIHELWMSAGEELRGLIPELDKVRRETGATLSGQTALAAQEQFGLLFDGEYSVDKLADAMAGLAAMSYQTGSQVENTKLMTITTLGIVAVEIMYALSMVPATFGGSLSWIPPLEVVTIAAIRAFFARLLARIAAAGAEAATKTGVRRLVRHAADEAVEEVVISMAQDGLVQKYQIDKGHAHGFDGKRFVTSLGGAAAGGGGAGVVHRPLGRVLGAGNSVLSKVLTGAVSHATLGLVGAITGAAAGGGPIDPMSLAGGMSSGALSGGAHGSGHHPDGGPPARPTPVVIPASTDTTPTTSDTPGTSGADPTDAAAAPHTTTVDLTTTPPAATGPATTGGGSASTSPTAGSVSTGAPASTGTGVRTHGATAPATPPATRTWAHASTAGATSATSAAGATSAAQGTASTPTPTATTPTTQAPTRTAEHDTAATTPSTTPSTTPTTTTGTGTASVGANPTTTTTPTAATTTTPTTTPTAAGTPPANSSTQPAAESARPTTAPATTSATASPTTSATAPPPTTATASGAAASATAGGAASPNVGTAPNSLTGAPHPTSTTAPPPDARPAPSSPPAAAAADGRPGTHTTASATPDATKTTPPTPMFAPAHLRNGLPGGSRTPPSTNDAGLPEAMAAVSGTPAAASVPGRGVAGPSSTPKDPWNAFAALHPSRAEWILRVTMIRLVGTPWAGDMDAVQEGFGGLREDEIRAPSPHVVNALKDHVLGRGGGRKLPGGAPPRGTASRAGPSRSGTTSNQAGPSSSGTASIHAGRSGSGNAVPGDDGADDVDVDSVGSGAEEGFARVQQLERDGNGRWLADGAGVFGEDLPDGRGVVLIGPAVDVVDIDASSSDGAGYVVVVRAAGDRPGALIRVPVVHPDRSRDEVLLTAAQLAEVVGSVLPGDTDRVRQSLVLVADGGELFTGSFAKELARATGRDVLAPGGSFGVSADGRFIGEAVQSWAPLPSSMDGRDPATVGSSAVPGRGRGYSEAELTALGPTLPGLRGVLERLQAAGFPPFRYTSMPTDSAGRPVSPESSWEEPTPNVVIAAVEPEPTPNAVIGVVEPEPTPYVVIAVVEPEGTVNIAWDDVLIPPDAQLLSAPGDPVVYTPGVVRGAELSWQEDGSLSFFDSAAWQWTDLSALGMPRVARSPYIRSLLPELVPVFRTDGTWDLGLLLSEQNLLDFSRSDNVVRDSAPASPMAGTGEETGEESLGALPGSPVGGMGWLADEELVSQSGSSHSSRSSSSSARPVSPAMSTEESGFEVDVESTAQSGQLGVAGTDVGEPPSDAVRAGGLAEGELRLDGGPAGRPVVSESGSRSAETAVGGRAPGLSGLSVSAALSGDEMSLPLGDETDRTLALMAQAAADGPIEVVITTDGQAHGAQHAQTLVDTVRARLINQVARLGVDRGRLTVHVERRSTAVEALHTATVEVRPQPPVPDMTDGDRALVDEVNRRLWPVGRPTAAARILDARNEQPSLHRVNLTQLAGRVAELIETGHIGRLRGGAPGNAEAGPSSQPADSPGRRAATALAETPAPRTAPPVSGPARVDAPTPSASPLHGSQGERASEAVDLERQAPKSIARYPKTLEGMTEVAAPRAIDTGAIAALVNRRRFGPHALSLGRLAGSHAEAMHEFTGDDFNVFLHAVGLSDQDIDKVWWTSFKSGSVYPSATLLGNILQYVAVPGIGLRYGATAALASSAAFVVAQIVSAAVLQPAVITLSEQIAKRNGPFIEVDKTKINYQVPLEEAARKLDEASNAYENTLKRWEKEEKRTNQTLNLGGLVGMSVTGRRDHLSTLSTEDRQTLKGLTSDVIKGESSVHAAQEQLFAAQGGQQRQQIGAAWQVPGRTARAPLSTALGFLTGASPGDGAAAGMRVQLVSPQLQVGLQGAANLAIQGVGHLLAGVDEYNKVMFKSSLNMLYADLLNDVGKRDWERGQPVTAKGIDEEKVRKLFSSPPEAVGKVVSKLVTPELDELRKLLEKPGTRANEQLVAKVDELARELEWVAKGRFDQLDEGGRIGLAMIDAASGLALGLVAREAKSKYTWHELRAQVVQRGSQAFHFGVLGSAAATLLPRGVAEHYGGTAELSNAAIGGLIAASFTMNLVGAYTQYKSQTQKNYNKEKEKPDSLGKQIGRGTGALYYLVKEDIDAARSGEGAAAVLKRGAEVARQARELLDALPEEEAEGEAAAQIASPSLQTRDAPEGPRGDTTGMPSLGSQNTPTNPATAETFGEPDMPGGWSPAPSDAESSDADSTHLPAAATVETADETDQADQALGAAGNPVAGESVLDRGYFSESERTGPPRTATENPSPSTPVASGGDRDRSSGGDHQQLNPSSTPARPGRSAGALPADGGIGAADAQPSGSGRSSTPASGGDDAHDDPVGENGSGLSHVGEPEPAPMSEPEPAMGQPQEGGVESAGDTGSSDVRTADSLAPPQSKAVAGRSHDGGTATTDSAQQLTQRPTSSSASSSRTGAAPPGVGVAASDLSGLGLKLPFDHRAKTVDPRDVAKIDMIDEFAEKVVEEAERRYTSRVGPLEVRVEGGGNGGWRSDGAQAVGLQRARAARTLLKKQIEDGLRGRGVPVGRVSFPEATSRGYALPADVATSVNEARRTVVVTTVEERQTSPGPQAIDLGPPSAGRPDEAVDGDSAPHASAERPSSTAGVGERASPSRPTGGVANDGSMPRSPVAPTADTAAAGRVGDPRADDGGLSTTPVEVARESFLDLQDSPPPGESFLSLEEHSSSEGGDDSDVDSVRTGVGPLGGVALIATELAAAANTTTGAAVARAAPTAAPVANSPQPPTGADAGRVGVNARPDDSPSAAVTPTEAIEPTSTGGHRGGRDGDTSGAASGGNADISDVVSGARFSSASMAPQGNPAVNTQLISTESVGIVNDLRAAMRPWVSLDDGRSLGPDLFGTRNAQPLPNGLPFIDAKDLQTSQLVPLFDAFNLTSTAPDPDPSSVDLTERVDSVRTNGRGKSMPRVFHAIWVGSVVPEPFRDTLVGWAAGVRADHTRFVLWTDIPRAAFQAASASDAEGSRLTGMLEWARQNQIVLLNVDEFFSARAPMGLNEQYRVEMGKLVGTGFGAASDILRLEILRRYGGLYTDVDNEFRSLDGIDELFQEHGFAVHSLESGFVNNSALLAERGHDFITTFLSTIDENYQLTQPDLYQQQWLPYEHEQDDAREVIGPDVVLRRHSIVLRTGPFALWDTAVAAGYPRESSESPHGAHLAELGVHPTLPRLVHQLKMGQAHSWQPRESPLAANGSWSVESVPFVSRRVVATLLRHLNNRPGDLYLTAVAPVIAGTPDPRGVWDAVLTFITELPGVAERIATVTHQLVYENTQGELVNDSLPEYVTARFEITESSRGQWVLGELQSEVAPGWFGGSHTRMRDGSARPDAPESEQGARPWSGSGQGSPSRMGPSITRFGDEESLFGGSDSELSSPEPSGDGVAGESATSANAAGPVQLGQPGQVSVRASLSASPREGLLPGGPVAGWMGAQRAAQRTTAGLAGSAGSEPGSGSLIVAGAPMTPPLAAPHSDPTTSTPQPAAGAFPGGGAGSVLAGPAAGVAGPAASVPPARSGASVGVQNGRLHLPFDQRATTPTEQQQRRAADFASDVAEQAARRHAAGEPSVTPTTDADESQWFDGAVDSDPYSDDGAPSVLWRPDSVAAGEAGVSAAERGAAVAATTAPADVSAGSGAHRAGQAAPSGPARDPNVSRASSERRPVQRLGPSIDGQPPAARAELIRAAVDRSLPGRDLEEGVRPVPADDVGAHGGALNGVLRKLKAITERGVLGTLADLGTATALYNDVSQYDNAEFINLLRENLRDPSARQTVLEALEKQLVDLKSVIDVELPTDLSDEDRRAYRVLSKNATPLIERGLAAVGALRHDTGSTDRILKVAAVVALMGSAFIVPVFQHPRAYNFIASIAGSEAKITSRLIGMARYGPLSTRLLGEYTLDALVPWFGPSITYALPTFVKSLGKYADDARWAGGAAVLETMFFFGTGYHRGISSLIGRYSSSDGRALANGQLHLPSEAEHQMIASPGRETLTQEGLMRRVALLQNNFGMIDDAQTLFEERARISDNLARQIGHLRSDLSDLRSLASTLERPRDGAPDITAVGPRPNSDRMPKLGYLAANAAVHAVSAGASLVHPISATDYIPYAAYVISRAINDVIDPNKTTRDAADTFTNFSAGDLAALVTNGLSLIVQGRIWETPKSSAPWFAYLIAANATYAPLFGEKISKAMLTGIEGAQSRWRTLRAHHQDPDDSYGLEGMPGGFDPGSDGGGPAALTTNNADVAHADTSTSAGGAGVGAGGSPSGTRPAAAGSSHSSRSSSSSARPVSPAMSTEESGFEVDVESTAQSGQLGVAGTDVGEPPSTSNGSLNLVERQSESVPQWSGVDGPQGLSGEQSSDASAADGEVSGAVRAGGLAEGEVRLDGGQRGITELWPPHLDRRANPVQAGFMGTPFDGDRSIFAHPGGTTAAPAEVSSGQDRSSSTDGRPGASESGVLQRSVLRASSLESSVLPDVHPLYVENHAVREWLESIGDGERPNVSRGEAVALSEVLPREHWWRMYLDSDDHAKALAHHPDNPGGLYDSDESPGFQADMEEAYRSVLDDPAALRQPMNWGEYRRLYAMATATASAQDGANFGDRSDDPDVKVEHFLGTERPADDLLTERVGGRPLVTEGHLHSVPEHLRDNVIDTLSPDEDGDLQLAPEYGADRVQELADAVFDRYSQDMNQASTEHEQLRAIGRVVRTLHVIHPFNDGNGRLNVYVLLPRLLQVNGFRPVIAPSMAHLFSGGFSLDHIARALRWGQDRDLSIGLDDMGESAPWHQTGDGVGGSGNASAQASGSDVATSASSDDTARRH